MITFDFSIKNDNKVPEPTSLKSKVVGIPNGIKPNLKPIRVIGHGAFGKLIFSKISLIFIDFRLRI